MVRRECRSQDARNAQLLHLQMLVSLLGQLLPTRHQLYEYCKELPPRSCTSTFPSYGGHQASNRTPCHPETMLCPRNPEQLTGSGPKTHHFCAYRSIRLILCTGKHLVLARPMLDLPDCRLAVVGRCLPHTWAWRLTKMLSLPECVVGFDVAVVLLLCLLAAV